MQHINIPFKRGDVCFVTSDDITPTGHEIWADRYAVIVSNDTNNKHANTVNVVYLTGNQKHRLHPTQVKLNVDGIHALALCEQIHCVDKSRLSIKKNNTLPKRNVGHRQRPALFITTDQKEHHRAFQKMGALHQEISKQNRRRTKIFTGYRT